MLLYHVNYIIYIYIYIYIYVYLCLYIDYLHGCFARLTPFLWCLVQKKKDLIKAIKLCNMFRFTDNLNSIIMVATSKLIIAIAILRN